MYNYAPLANSTELAMVHNTLITFVAKIKLGLIFLTPIDAVGLDKRRSAML